MKNGPPERAVTIPTGKSMGARTVLPNESHNMMKIAPNNIEAGVKVLWSGPKIKRAM